MLRGRPREQNQLDSIKSRLATACKSIGICFVSVYQAPDLREPLSSLSAASQETLRRTLTTGVLKLCRARWKATFFSNRSVAPVLLFLPDAT